MTERVVAVVGTGVIGAAWATLFLSRGATVRAYDPGPGAADRLRAAVTAAWPTVVALGAPDEPQLDRLRFTTDLAEAVHDVCHVQENGPEVLDLKRAVVAELDRQAPADCVIASSSSGLRPSDLQAACLEHPERVLVGHPFHPAHLIPLVEVVGGAATSPEAVRAAMDFYTSMGKRPIRVRHELPGHVVNRLQAALWREAYSLVERGVVTVGELDAAITNGPGLRWAAVGPFAGQHLSGGEGGIAHTLEHLGPPMVAWWEGLGDPTWSRELVETVVAQITQEFSGHEPAKVAVARDRVLIEILAAKSRADLPT